MVGFADMLMALALAQGAHTTGHFASAQNQEQPLADIPMTLNTQRMSEEYDHPDTWRAAKEGDPWGYLHQSRPDYVKEYNNRDVDLAGAGFANQDTIRNLVGDPELKKNMSLANAAIKGGYMLGIPQLRSGGASQNGDDIATMEKSGGGKYVKPMLGFSMLMDILKGTGAIKDNGVDVGFTTIDGAPGLKVSGKW